MQRFPWRTRCALAAAGVIAGVAAIGAPSALAHDSVIGGNPENGSVVSEFPDSITLEFSGQPKEGFNTVALSRVSDGEILFTGEPELNERLVTVDVPAEVEEDAEPGEYQVGFQIISSDGHSTKGRTTFTYEPTAEVDSEGTGDGDVTGDAASEDAATQDSGMSAGVLIGVIVAVIAVLGVGIVLIGRKKK